MSDPPLSDAPRSAPRLSAPPLDTSRRRPTVSTMLEVSGLTHQYGQGERAHVAVQDLTFSIEAGQLACIVGPSGCGKSTLLRCISGLIEATGGSVRLHGDEVSGVPDEDRKST